METISPRQVHKIAVAADVYNRTEGTHYFKMKAAILAVEAIPAMDNETALKAIQCKWTADQLASFNKKFGG